MFFRGRAPYGARGLKFKERKPASVRVDSRAPYGARGLKSGHVRQRRTEEQSRPIRGAWIEIRFRCQMYRFSYVAPHTGRVD